MKTLSLREAEWHPLVVIATKSSRRWNPTPSSDSKACAFLTMELLPQTSLWEIPIVSWFRRSTSQHIARGFMCSLKLREMSSSLSSWVSPLVQTWWLLPAIPTTCEVYVGKSCYEASPGKAQDAIWKTNEKEKNWGLGLSGRVLTLQAQGPEFNPQYQTSPTKIVSSLYQNGPVPRLKTSSDLCTTLLPGTRA
jgi:hypothetical protein